MSSMVCEYFCWKFWIIEGVFCRFLKKSEVSFVTAQEPLAGGQWLHVRHALALFAQEFQLQKGDGHNHGLVILASGALLFDIACKLTIQAT